MMNAKVRIFYKHIGMEVDDAISASHVTLWWGHPDYNSTTELPANDLEIYALQRMAETREWGTANVLTHSARSSTAALAIGSNPISMLTWYGRLPCGLDYYS